MQRTRIYQIWEYQVSHASLLIRSPRSPRSGDLDAQVENCDLHFSGVTYMHIANLMRGLEVVTPTHDEVQEHEAFLYDDRQLFVLKSEERRYLICARSMTYSENNWDLFESPIEFRSLYREGGGHPNLSQVFPPNP